MLFSLLLFAEEAAQNQKPDWAIPLLPLVVMAPLFIWMMWRAKKQEQKQRESLYSSLKKNDRVLTSGGLIGIIAAIRDTDEEVTLKVDESSNVRLRVLRSAIVRVLGAESSEKEQKDGTA